MRTLLFAPLALLVSMPGLAQTASFRLVPAQPAPQSSSVITEISDDGSVVAGYLKIWRRCLECCCTEARGAQAFRQAGDQPVERIPKLPGVPGAPNHLTTALSGNGAIVYGRWSELTGTNAGSFRYANGQVVSMQEHLGSSPVDASADGSVILYPGAVRRGQTFVAFPLPPGDFAAATDFSADTRIAVGVVSDVATYHHAAIWTDHVLAVLPEPEGYVVGSVSAVSDDGRVVAGDASRQGAFGSDAILWVDGVPRLLVDPQLLVDASVYAETEAYPASSSTLDVSGDGRVALVRIQRNDAYDEHDAFLWDEANGLRRVRDVLRYDFRLPAGPFQGTANVLSSDGRSVAGSQVSGPELRQGWVATIPDGCANGLDDDADGAVDLADPGCVDGSDYSERGPGIGCDDGVDDDGDDLADFPDDPSCPSPSHPLESNCADSEDNDGDGLADFADPGCTDSADLFETNPAAPCDDGEDDDGDGRSDLLDPGCDDLVDPSEQSPLLACDDGQDDDADGFADLGDEGCGGMPEWPSESPPCSDGIDNDGDGLVDFTEDPECFGEPYRLRERAGTCGLGAELAAIVPALYCLRSRRQRK